MTDEQFYRFDSWGMAVARRAVPPDQVAYINATIDRALGGKRSEKFSVMELDPVFMEIMVHPWIVSACTQIIGDRFRFDHGFGLEQPTARPNLHGGPQAGQGAAFYHAGPSAAGAAWVGRISVGIALTPQSEATGGMIFVPGSHKSSRLLHGSKVLSDILKGDYQSDCICTPRLEPGDVYVFPDCLVHGTSPWRGPSTRRSLYYMYSPGYMAWRSYAEIEKYLPLAKTPLQKQLLRPPYVLSYEESQLKVGTNRWREPTAQG